MFGGLKKTLCNKCNREIGNNSFKRHEISCDGTYFTGPHNPNKSKYKDKSAEEIEKLKKDRYENLRLKNIGRPAWNKGLTKESDTRVKKYSESLIGNSNIGRCIDPQKEIERIKKLSIAAKKQGFGGYRPNAGRTKKFKVQDSYGKEVVLQSTYELKCSEILNSLNIRWIRPTSLLYDGKRYFADFYLTDYNLYLDPKNSYKARQDREKIEKVINQNNVKVLVLLQEHLTKEFIASVIQ